MLLELPDFEVLLLYDPDEELVLDEGLLYVGVELLLEVLLLLEVVEVLLEVVALLLVVLPTLMPPLLVPVLGLAVLVGLLELVCPDETEP